MTQVEAATIDRRKLNDSGYDDALKAPGGSLKPARVPCLAFVCPSGLDFSEGHSPSDWVCDGEVPYDLVNGIHYQRLKPAIIHHESFSLAAGENIDFYWEIDFSGTTHLLPPRLVFQSGRRTYVRADISTEGLLRAYLNGFRSGIADRLQMR